MLQIGVDHHDHVAGRVLEPGQHGRLLAEVAGQLHAADPLVQQACCRSGATSRRPSRRRPAPARSGGRRRRAPRPAAGRTARPVALVEDRRDDRDQGRSSDAPRQNGTPASCQVARRLSRSALRRRTARGSAVEVLMKAARSAHRRTSPARLGRIGHLQGHPVVQLAGAAGRGRVPELLVGRRRHRPGQHQHASTTTATRRHSASTSRAPAAVVTDPASPAPTCPAAASACTSRSARPARRPAPAAPPRPRRGRAPAGGPPWRPRQVPDGRPASTGQRHERQGRHRPGQAGPPPPVAACHISGGSQATIRTGRPRARPAERDVRPR